MTSRPTFRMVLALLSFAATARAAETSAADAGSNLPAGADAGKSAAPAVTKAKAAKKIPTDEASAIQIVSDLPEVDQVAAELKKANVPLVLRRDDQNESGPYEIAVAEDHDDHEVTRYRFSVDRKTGAIKAYEVECDLWSPLAKWRAMRAKMAKMTLEARDAFDTCAALDPAKK